MNDKIKEEEVKVLEAASREYPTWGCFKDIIDEAKNKDFPSSNFDCQPIQCPNHPLVPVLATPDIICFLKIMNKAIRGIDTHTTAAIIAGMFSLPIPFSLIS